MNKLIENEIESKLFDTQQINEQFINEYIYKLSLFNPKLHTKICNLCALAYLLAKQLKLTSEQINLVYMYASLYYIKDNRVIQLKMSKYCKKFDNIKKIQQTGISYYTEHYIELIIMVCDEFIELMNNNQFNKCIDKLRKNEIVPQIIVTKLEEIGYYKIKESLK